MDLFLENKFLMFGVDGVFHLSNLHNTSDVFCETFPTVLSCQVNIGGPAGNMDSVNSICLLHSNMFNQKELCTKNIKLYNSFQQILAQEQCLLTKFPDHTHVVNFENILETFIFLNIISKFFFLLYWAWMLLLAISSVNLVTLILKWMFSPISR